MKYLLILCIYASIFTVSGISVTFSTSWLSDRHALTIETERETSRSWHMESDIELALREGFEGILAFSIASPSFLLGDLSRDARTRALNGSYLILKPQAAKQAGMSLSPAKGDAVYAAFPLTGGRYLLAHTDHHLHAVSYVSETFGFAVTHQRRSGDQEVPYIDWQSDRGPVSTDAYLLVQTHAGVFQAESYLKATDDQISSKSHITVALEPHHLFTVSRVVFSHRLHTWEHDITELERREKLRYQGSYTGVYGELTAEARWTFRSYRALPYALHRGEEGGEFSLSWQWRSLSLSWERVWESDRWGSEDLSDTLTFAYASKGEFFDWRLTASAAFDGSLTTCRTRVLITSERVRTSLTVTYRRELSVSLVLKYAIEKDWWSSELAVSERGLKAQEITIDL